MRLIWALTDRRVETVRDKLQACLAEKQKVEQMDLVIDEKNLRLAVRL